MKKLFFLTLLIAFGLRSGAQTVTLSVITPPCDSDGVVVATFSGMPTPYNVQWYSSSGSITHTGITITTDTLYGFCGGYVQVYGMDTATSTYAFDSLFYAPTFSASITATGATCPALGTLNATVSGGTGPYTYKWLDYYTHAVVATTNPASVPRGVYLIRVTDVGTGCVTGFTNGPVEVIISPDFTATVTTTDANCTNGTASVAITGGTAPFSYLWSNGATTPSISGLVTDYYYLVVTDALGCTNDSSSLGGYVAQAITIDVHTVATPATCLSADGAITAFGSGGMGPYSYSWSNGATTPTISGLTSNYYDVTATDANGCIGWGGDYVSASTPISVTYTSTPSLCTSPTGTATLSITGGTPPYAIEWYTIPVQTTATANALPAGTYYFHVTDAIGCVQSGAVVIQPIDIITLSFTSTPATCLASDGAVAVFPSGGVAPYTYSWNTGATTYNLTGIASNTYDVTVTDHNGCAVNKYKYVGYNSPLNLGLSSSPASCLYTSNGSITATASMGTPPYNYSMGGSSSGPVTIPGLATGPYWIYVTDAHGCNAYEYTHVGYNVSDSSCFCVVKGTVYNDPNHNCTQDAGEPGIQNIQMQASGFGYTYTNPSGDYYFLLPSGTYTISQTVLSIYPLSPCQSNNIPVTVSAGTGCYHTIDFADTLTPIHDMHISTWDYTFARPGFPYTQATVITNDGTVTESNILSGYKPDARVFGATIVPSGIFNGPTTAPFYYNTTGSSFGLTPGDGQEFLMNYNVPADVPLSSSLLFTDTVAYTSPMLNWLSDYSPWNNVNYFTTVTVGSYDPNFKEVSPKGYGTAGTITTDDSVLEYMVHFQNTGSYMAENVVVIDTLDANVDWKTLRPVFTSDKCVVTINESGVATFTFNHINLPASSSEPVASNAMFTYTVKQRPGLAIGSTIHNRASIYFDFNGPIVTNSTLNTIGHAENVPSTTTTTGYNSFVIYPNPAQNTFNAIVELTEGGTYNLNVCDVTGKTAISKSLSLQKGSQNFTVDVSRLTPGVYFVTLNGNDNKAQTQKLVIMK